MTETFRREYQPKDDKGAPLGPPQVFEADTAEELLDKISTAHENATKRIWELKARIKPEPYEPLPEFKPRVLTNDERFALAHEFQNPETFESAFDKVSEAKYGAKPEAVVKLMNRAVEAQEAAEIKEAADNFKEAHPEYKICRENWTALGQWMEQHQAKGTLQDLEMAWDDLQMRGLAKLNESQPEVPEVKEEPKPEAITPERRQRSSGLFAQHSSAGAPRAKATDEKFRQEVRGMRAEELRRRITSDPSFAARLNALK